MTPAARHWVLLHGTPLTPACWSAVAERLAPHGRVDVPDVTPLSEDPDLPGDVARRVADAYPEGVGGADLDVVGHSFGGQVALELALLRPGRLRSLTVLCSRDTPYPPFAAAADAVAGGGPVDVDAVLGRWFTPAELTAVEGPAADVVAYARTTVAHADRAAWAAALAAIARYDASGRVGGIRAPVTLVAAEHDSVSTPAAMAEMAGRLPHATLEVLAGAGHLSAFTDPAALAARLLALTAVGGGMAER